MSGVAYKTKRDIINYRKAYMDSLALEEKNIDMNYKANQIYQSTGAPSQPVDTRDTTEKLGDLEKLRIMVRSRLSEIMSGSDANEVSASLPPEELQFVSQQINFIINDLKPKYALGVPAQIFAQYVVRLMQKMEQTQGVDLNFQQDNLPTPTEIRGLIRDIRQLAAAAGGGRAGPAQGQAPANPIVQNIVDNLQTLQQTVETIQTAVNVINDSVDPTFNERLAEQVQAALEDVPTQTQFFELVEEVERVKERNDYNTYDRFINRTHNETMPYSELQEPTASIIQTLQESPSARERARARALQREREFGIQREPLTTRPTPIPTQPLQFGSIEIDEEMEGMDENERQAYQEWRQARSRLEMATRPQELEQEEEEVPVTSKGRPPRRFESIGRDPKIFLENVAYGYIPPRDIPGLFGEKRLLTSADPRPYGKPATEGYLTAIRLLGFGKLRLQKEKDILNSMDQNMNFTEFLTFTMDNDRLIKRIFEKAEPSEDFPIPEETFTETNPMLETPQPRKKVPEATRMQEFTDLPRPTGIATTEGATPIAEYFGGKPVTRSTSRSVTGKGVRMRGRGVVVDESAGVMAEPDYIPFGKHLLNRRRLRDGVVMIKRRSGAFIPQLKTKLVSPNLQKVFQKMAGGMVPSFSELEQLDDDEREYLNHVASRTALSSKFAIPSPKKNKDEQLVNSFNIIRGQLIAGNDSKDMINKFKKILVEMIDRELIPKSQTREILIELARLE